MDSREAERLHLLKSSCVPVTFLTELFGISWPPGGDLPSDFEAWLNSRRKRRPCPDGQESRGLAETFLQDHRLQPLPWAAARLGMHPDALVGLLPALPKVGLRRNYQLYPGLIDEALGDDLIRSLRGLRFRTFGTHDSFCELLHKALQDEAGIKLLPWYCATSEEIGEYPKRFASYLDSVTLRPLSTRHAVWLDLGKPLNLAPDRCSKLFYLRNRDALKGFLAGRGEPDGLDRYGPFVGEPEGAARG